MARLEEQDLVRTKEAGRSRTIEMTEAGAEKLEEAYPLWRTVQAKIERAVGTENWPDARSLLRSLTDTGAAL